MEITLGLAFAAGFISFISPCVLPLVPAYISYMGGRVTNTVAAQAAGGGTQVQSKAVTRVSTGLHSLFFVTGFTLVFVGIGLLTTAFLGVVGGGVNTATALIGRVGGIVIIVFGLHFMGALSWLFNWLRQRASVLNLAFTIGVALFGAVLIFWAFDLPPSPLNPDANIFNRTLISLPVFTAFAMWLVLGGAFTKPQGFWLNLFTKLELSLYADTRKQMAASGYSGFGGSTLMGVVFAAGWTPCIGPIYGAILTLAANGGSVSQAGAMLTAYSLGLGIPFIVTALLLDSAQGMLRGLNKHMGTIKLASGAFLIAIGLMVASGQLQRLSTLGGQGSLGVISYNMEECFTGAVAGQVPWGDVFNCVNENEFETVAATGAASTGAATTADTTTDTNTAATAPVLETRVDVDTTTVEGAEVGINVGDVAPNFLTYTTEGEPLLLEDLRGQTVLLNFWATWCGPCRIEMPQFQQAYDEHRDDGFVIVAVNNRESEDQILGFQEELGLTFPLALDARGDIQNQYALQSYPSTYLINEDGVIVERHLGTLTADAITELIEEALG